MSAPTPDDVVLLAMMIRGEVIVPENTLEFEAQCNRMHNFSFSANKPLMFIMCNDTGDVQEALKFVNTHSLPLSIRSRGHSACGSSQRKDTVVLDVSGIHEVQYDATTEQVTFGPGATLSDLNVHLLRHNRMTPLGVAPPTGCGGLVLHGGLGWLKGRFGMSVDNVTGITMVLADTTVKTLSHDSEGEDKELFYGVRGAAGVLGVVTSITMTTYPMEMVYGGFWVMPDDDKYTRSRHLMKLLQSTVLKYEEEEKRPSPLIGAVHMCNVPPEESIPEELRGKPATLCVMYAYGVDDKAADELVKPFCQADEICLGKPPAPMPFNVFNQIFSGFFLTFPRLANYWKCGMAMKIPEEALDALVDKWSSHEPWLSPSLVGIEAHGFTGRKTILSPGQEHCVGNAGNYRFAFLFLLYFPPRDDDLLKSAKTMSQELHALLEKFQSSVYCNYVTELEKGQDTKDETGLNYCNLERLRALKARVDPKNLFTRSVIKAADVSAQ